MPISRPPKDKLKIFFSYAREDADTKTSLEKYLIHLKRAERIWAWSDCEILPGMAWDDEIRKQLADCDLILLLMSVDFLNSRYIWDVELKSARARHMRGELEIIPILVRPLPDGANPFPGLEALPTDAKPISTWDDREQALVDIADGIKRAIDNRAVRIQAKISNNALEDSNPYGGTYTDSIFCDRDEQEYEFLTTCRHWLRERPGIPQIFLIRGEPLDRPDTLVERLYRRKIPGLMPNRPDTKKVRVRPGILHTQRRDLGWPKFAFMLVDDLFEKAGLQSHYSGGFDLSDISASPLISEFRMKPYSFVVVRHDIDAGRLGSSAADFVQWYANDFFRGVIGGESLPEFLIFVNLIYPEASSDRSLLSLLRRREFQKPRELVNTSLKRLFHENNNNALNSSKGSSGCPCKLMTELSPLDMEHLRLWMLQSQPPPTETEAADGARWLFAELQRRSRGPVRLDLLQTWLAEAKRNTTEVTNV